MIIGYPLPTTQAIDDLIQQAHNLRLDNTRLALQISQQARAQALQVDYQRGPGIQPVFELLVPFHPGG